MGEDRRIEVFDGPPGHGRFVRAIPADADGFPLQDDDLEPGHRYVAMVPAPGTGVLVPQEIPVVTQLRVPRPG